MIEFEICGSYSYRYVHFLICAGFTFLLYMSSRREEVEIVNISPLIFFLYLYLEIKLAKIAKSKSRD